MKWNIFKKLWKGIKKVFSLFQNLPYQFWYALGIVLTILVLYSLISAHRENARLKEIQIQQEKTMADYEIQKQSFNDRIDSLSKNLQTLDSQIKEKDKTIAFLSKKRKDIRLQPEKEIKDVAQTFTSLGYRNTVVSR